MIGKNYNSEIYTPEIAQVFESQIVVPKKKASRYNTNDVPRHITYLHKI